MALDYLDPDRAGAAFRCYFGLEPPAGLRDLAALTPGDFALVRRKAEILDLLGEPESLAENAAQGVRGQAGNTAGRGLPGVRFGPSGSAAYGALGGDRHGRGGMRYEPAARLVRLAVLMQGRQGGVTLDDIQSEFEVGRRTAERMRDAVGEAFRPAGG